MQSAIRGWLQSFLYLIFPPQCAACGASLQDGEEVLCLKCSIDMPRTNYHLREDNPTARLYWGKIPLERATSFFFYRKGGSFRRVLHLLKYGGRKDIGEVMGRFMAAELSVAGFFQEIDYVIPVPLHLSKQRLRGYNQSECIAQGISAVTGVPLEASLVVREKHTETQTRKSAYERWVNVNGTFRLQHPERFTGKHVLLVDDVLTTGATLTACADAFREVEGIRISILTLAVADS